MEYVYVKVTLYIQPHILFTQQNMMKLYIHLHLLNIHVISFYQKT